MNNAEIRTAAIATLRGLADALEKDPNAVVVSLQQTRGTKEELHPSRPGRFETRLTGDFMLVLTLANFGSPDKK